MGYAPLTAFRHLTTGGQPIDRSFANKSPASVLRFIRLNGKELGDLRAKHHPAARIARLQRKWAGPWVQNMTGTPAQIEWAERIKRQVNGEFDRMAASFRTVAEKQIEKKRLDTKAIIAILEEKRAEVMSRDQAGYFIQEWQEIGNQLQKIVHADKRYQAIRIKSAAHVVPKT